MKGPHESQHVKRGTRAVEWGVLEELAQEHGTVPPQDPIKPPPRIIEEANTFHGPITFGRIRYVSSRFCTYVASSFNFESREAYIELGCSECHGRHVATNNLNVPPGLALPFPPPPRPFTVPQVFVVTNVSFPTLMKR